jgi:hypothetical protein
MTLRLLKSTSIVNFLDNSVNLLMHSAVTCSTKSLELAHCAEEHTVNNWLDKEHNMAIYQSANGNVSTYDDDKLGFDDWVSSDPEREILWQAAASAHQRWQAANPTLHPSMAHDTANTMFQEWVDYANAIRILPT